MQVDFVYPSLLGGVSQQPVTQRFVTQAERSVNTYPSLVSGLRKRPGLVHADEIALATDDTFVHRIDRDASERYLVAISDGDIKVFDLTGKAYTVTGTLTYLNGVTAADVKAFTVKDFTFILNKSKVVSMAGTTSAAPSVANEAYIQVNQGAYSTDYRVTVNANTYTCTTFDGTTTFGTGLGSGTIDSIQTEDIAEDLRLQLAGDASITSATRQGSVIRITFTGATWTTLETTDSISDSGLTRIWKEVEIFQDLPTICTHGFKVKVAGNVDSGIDDYFVVFESTDGSAGFKEGTWRETIDYSTVTSLDATTMPHELRRLQDDASGTITGTPFEFYFDFSTVSWTDRTVGDATLNPDPSIVGKSIQELFFWRNRFWLCADEQVVGSAAGDFFNFFRTTVRQLLDRDRVDVSTGNTRVSVINHAVPYAESMVLMSDRDIFRMSAEPAVTPTTLEIQRVASFESIPGTEPVALGRSIFFPFVQGAYSGIKELFQVGDADIFDAVDATAPVPRYISGTAKKVIGTTLADIVLVLSGNTGVWLYKYVYDGSDKAQSAWQQIQIPQCDLIISVEFFDDVAYFVLKRGSTYSIESMDFSEGLTAGGLDFPVYLDRMIDESDCTVAYAAGVTTITIPWTYTNTDETVAEFRVVTYDAPKGVVLVPTRAGTDVTIPGDYSGRSFYLGVRYSTEHEFSEPLLRSRGENGPVVDSLDHYVLQQAQFHHQDSMYYQVEVSPELGYSHTYTFARDELGLIVIGEPSADTGFFQVPLRSRGQGLRVTLKNDSPLPSNWSSAQWLCSRYKKSRRIS